VEQVVRHRVLVVREAQEPQLPHYEALLLQLAVQAVGLAVVHPLHLLVAELEVCMALVALALSALVIMVAAAVAVVQEAPMVAEVEQ
jgi:hypothetical protein